MQDKQVQNSTVYVTDDSRMRSSGHPYPAFTKKVFFERYSDSPEFARINNPVMGMRHQPELDDEDDSDVVDPSSKLANYQSPMDRLKRDPLGLRRLAAFGAHKQANADVATKDNKKTRAVTTVPSVDLGSFAEDKEISVDDDDEEPEDDTFEFLLN